VVAGTRRLVARAPGEKAVDAEAIAPAVVEPAEPKAAGVEAVEPVEDEDAGLAQPAGLEEPAFEAPVAHDEDEPQPQVDAAGGAAAEPSAAAGAEEAGQAGA
jgi:hypothetical protein